MYTVEFHISVCCLQAVFVDWKLKVFPLEFPPCFWVIGAASRPHCSQSWYCPRTAGRQLHSEGLWAGRVWQVPPPGQGRCPQAGVTSLGQGHQPAQGKQGPAQGTRAGQSPGMAGQDHSAGQGEEGTGSEEDEGRATTACSCSQSPAKSRWEIPSVGQPFLGLSHSHSRSEQVCFAPSFCSTSFLVFFYHLCENAEGMSVHICS